MTAPRDEARIAYTDDERLRALVGRWVQRHEMARAQAAALARALDEQAVTVEEAKPPPATAAGDPRRLRGLPAIGYGVGGAIPGTRPDTAVLRLDGRQGTPGPAEPAWRALLRARAR